MKADNNISDFKTELAKRFHTHFGHIRDQAGKRIKPYEIIDWLSKNASQFTPVIGESGEEEKENRTYTYSDMMGIAGWMAAADNKSLVSELKEEAEAYIEKLITHKSQQHA